MTSILNKYNFTLHIFLFFLILNSLHNSKSDNKIYTKEGKIYTDISIYFEIKTWYIYFIQVYSLLINKNTYLCILNKWKLLSQAVLYFFWFVLKIHHGQCFIIVIRNAQMYIYMYFQCYSCHHYTVVCFMNQIISGNRMSICLTSVVLLKARSDTLESWPYFTFILL